VILFKEKYWTLSLRMSKCIYRHIRLSKGFNNIQNVHGVQTLRIPQLLLNEKKRTQARFEVFCHKPALLAFISLHDYLWNALLGAAIETHKGRETRSPEFVFVSLWTYKSNQILWACFTSHRKCMVWKKTPRPLRQENQNRYTQQSTGKCTIRAECVMLWSSVFLLWEIHRWSQENFWQVSNFCQGKYPRFHRAPRASIKYQSPYHSIYIYDWSENGVY